MPTVPRRPRSLSQNNAWEGQACSNLVLPHVLLNVADPRCFASGTEDFRIAIQHVPRWLVTQS
jgi:hypothetical protein